MKHELETNQEEPTPVFNEILETQDEILKNMTEHLDRIQHKLNRIILNKVDVDGEEKGKLPEIHTIVSHFQRNNDTLEAINIQLYEVYQQLYKLVG